MQRSSSQPDFQALVLAHAREFFVLYKFFAFPIVDEKKRIVGVVDVNLFAEEMLQNESVPNDSIFEVLGLNESVSVQSMTVTIQTLRAGRPIRRWFLENLRRECATALLLGLACGLVTLAATDFFALSFYFSLAWLVL